MSSKKKRGKASSVGVLATNRKARHEYHLFDRFEAGICLTGTEVKSVRQGGINLKEGYARVSDGEVFLHGAHISPYTHGNRENVEPVRTRKLLLNSREIRKLSRLTETTGMTLVATRAYLKNGFVKIEIAVARGKKMHDKRESTREREMQREMDRARGAQRD
jgi:SsrA-binding protein